MVSDYSGWCAGCRTEYVHQPTPHVCGALNPSLHDTLLDDAYVLLRAEKARVAELRAEVERLRELLHEFVHSGVEFDDPRIDYIVMQVDRTVLDDARAALRGEEGA